MVGLGGFSPLFSFFSQVAEPGSTEACVHGGSSGSASCALPAKTHLLTGLKCLFPFPCRTKSLIISSLEFKQTLILVGANII